MQGLELLTKIYLYYKVRFLTLKTDQEKLGGNFVKFYSVVWRFDGISVGFETISDPKMVYIDKENASK